jgi:endoglucanase
MVAGMVTIAALGVGCSRQPDTALHPDPPNVRYAPLRHPFADATLYVDTATAAARWQKAHGADWLDPITSRPQARWINGPRDLAGAPRMVSRAKDRGEIPVFVAYYIPNRGCTDFKQGAPDTAAYDAYLRDLVDALGAVSSVIVLEPDALTADCYNTSRGKLLTRAVKTLTSAGHSVYLDAGHSRWRSSGETATRLLQSGITDAEGFAVNVSNRQTTADSYRWGLELSDLVGDRDFVIDTSRNGSGPPPDDPKRDDEWCNPQKQALGAPPQITHRPHLAALLWIKAPGESDGKCGGEHTYLFSPTQAGNLIAAARWLPQAERAAARSAS